MTDGNYYLGHLAVLVRLSHLEAFLGTTPPHPLRVAQLLIFISPCSASVGKLEVPGGGKRH